MQHHTRTVDRGPKGPLTGHKIKDEHQQEHLPVSAGMLSAQQTKQGCQLHEFDLYLLCITRKNLVIISFYNLTVVKF